MLLSSVPHSDPPRHPTLVSVASVGLRYCSTVARLALWVIVLQYADCVLTVVEHLKAECDDGHPVSGVWTLKDHPNVVWPLRVVIPALAHDHTIIHITAKRLLRDVSQQFLALLTLTPDK